MPPKSNLKGVKAGWKSPEPPPPGRKKAYRGGISTTGTKGMSRNTLGGKVLEKGRAFLIRSTGI